MTIKDLASMQRADPSLLSRALPEMRRKGFVTMRRSETDSRQTIVEVSQAGRAAYDRAAPVMARRRAALKEVYSEEELVEFVNYLDRLDMFLRAPIEDIVAKEQI
jgi:DNA-binding MarR family transcriptional regulator